MDLERAFQQHGWHVFRRARRYLGSEDEAWDVCQEVFLKLAEHRESLRHPEHLATWLYRVTTHRCIDRIRLRKDHDPARLDGLLDPADPERHAAGRHLLGKLAGKIPTDDLQLLALRYLEGLKFEELEQVTGLTRKTLRKRLSRSLRQAERLLQGAAPGSPSEVTP